MARKNKRLKKEYRKGLGFDPKKYITSSLYYSIHVDDERIPQRGEVWIADLGNHQNSSVQGGVRPVIIVSNNIGNVHADTVNIVPMTRHQKKLALPCHIQISPYKIADKQQMLDVSMVLAEQITTISKYALKKYAGKIKDKLVLEKINAAVAAQLSITTTKEMF